MSENVLQQPDFGLMVAILGTLNEQVGLAKKASDPALQFVQALLSVQSELAEKKNNVTETRKIVCRLR